jgi:hypothetical protein
LKSDYAAVFDGAASVSPLHLDRTHELSLNHLSHWAAKLGSTEQNPVAVPVTPPVSK